MIADVMRVTFEQSLIFPDGKADKDKQRIGGEKHGYSGFDN